MKKQMTYANNRKIPFVILIGEEEIKHQKVTLKNMQSGAQQTLPFAEAITLITAP